jgi:hypothetical protein
MWIYYSSGLRLPQSNHSTFSVRARFYLALQEWLAAPTAVAYADGQMSGPSAYVRSMAAAHLAPRRRHTLGVETDTPTATLGVLKAVGVALACAPVPLRP